MGPTTSTLRYIYSVSQLNSEASAVLSTTFPLLWVEGEISNLAKPASGHMYFTLKDATAQVRCTMFRQYNLRLAFKPVEGMQVLIRARVGLYERRGDFQLNAEHMEEAGSGRLQLEFERLKQKLNDEGLFDSSHKQALPAFPRRLGIITSASGAALQDILNVLKRRFPVLKVTIYPSLVQGDNAAANLVDMLHIAESRAECDVLLLTRGGGSLEDLWPFNNEALARAIADCTIPVVSGVGHEIDYTICDFVADVRAPTPSAAAELISPNQDDVERKLVTISTILHRRFTQNLSGQSQNLSWLQKRLDQLHPGARILQRTQRLDELDMQLGRTILHLITGLETRLKYAGSNLARFTPASRIKTLTVQLQQLNRRLYQAFSQQQVMRQNSLEHLGRALSAVSPDATLSRGYAIITRLPQQSLVQRSSDVDNGDILNIRLSAGRLTATVKTIQED